MTVRSCPAVLLLLLLPQIALALPVGKVTGSHGGVSFKTSAGSAYRPLVKGQELEEGSWVKSGKDGWIELTLSDKSRFTIANNSELEITRYLVGKEKRDGAFNLVQGKLRASVVKLAGRQTEITVRSGTAVAGVKGTEFLMLTRGPANVFFGNEGTVAVSGLSGQEEPLTSDTMTQTTRGSHPVKAVKVEQGTPLAKAREAFQAATGDAPPQEWGDVDALPDMLARWDINHGHYLSDVGRYDEALQALQISLDLATLPAIRADAHLERAGVFARFLKDPKSALAEYGAVIEEYPELPQKETALYCMGQALYEMGEIAQAKTRLRQYLAEYPSGRYRSSVETIMKVLER